MKKQYVIPYTKVVSVELQKFIAASTDNVTVDEDYIETSSDNVASRRRGGLWDDED